MSRRKENDKKESEKDGCGPEIEGRPDLLLLEAHILPVTE